MILEEEGGPRPDGGHGVRGVQTAQHPWALPEDFGDPADVGGRALAAEDAGGHRGHSECAFLPDHGQQSIDHGVGAAFDFAKRGERAMHQDNIAVFQSERAQIAGDLVFGNLHDEAPR